MTSRHAAVRRPLAAVLAAAISGVPGLAAAADPPAVRAAATPIADAASEAVAHQSDGGGNGNPALKWTGFGLIAGGGTLVALGAVLDDEDCFDNDIAAYDCDDVRKVAYVTGGAMAGVGVALMIMGRGERASRDPGRYPSVTLQRGRVLVRQHVRF